MRKGPKVPTARHLRFLVAYVYGEIRDLGKTKVLENKRVRNENAFGS